jgi:hypothetical protein
MVESLAFVRYKRIKSSQAVSPEALVVLKPTGCLPQWHRIERQHMVTAPNRTPHQASALKNLDVLRRRVQGNRKISCEFGDARVCAR